ncbi:flagellar hook protein FlgE [Paractinoplanes durhamensis]|uniref:Flagellar hook protein FlgE n=1 Tax=Paractinoplanes durhamensis TaxID=113563 RepID=A0ABQ3YQ24_9ACTN|nr:flagellar hook protein FlgE [Actinoplanes durhamensis]GID99689.1 flagellar hook protein FlgE [Actinoplanes durhamensis]
MLRSLYSGISGLHAHQQMMDITGNNIANVNTVGFKASSVQFQDTLSQMIGAAGAPQGTMGGTNPAQVGLGVRNAGIISNWTQGSQETTGRAGDMMIQGDGFFITRNGNENLYTRAGSFSFDGNGLLTTATGEPVQGWTATDGVVNSASKPGDITMPLGSTIPAKATTAITLKGNLTSDTTGVATDYPKNYAIPVKVYDKLGTPSTQIVNFQQDATGAYAVYYPWDTATNSGTQVTDLPTGGGTQLTFGTTEPGKPDATSFKITNNSDPSNPYEYTVDISDITNFSGQSDARVFDADGQVAGALTSLSYTVSDTGQIVGVYSNGLKQVLGQIAMATFKNVNGLEKTGDSSYRSTVNSGYPQVGVPASAGMGQVISGALEMSNVDLAQEFTNLVIAQRGFQANSRVITTSDELLQELVSMKR